MHQKIKDYLGIAGIVGIVAAALVAWQIGNTYSKSIQPGAYRSFSVSAEGKSVAIPDIATFAFRVITEGGKDLSGLQSQNAYKTNKVVDFIKSKGVDAKDIKTSEYNVDPRYQYSNCGPLGSDTCPPPAIVGYTVTQAVAVKVRDLAKSGEIIGGVVDNGANSVSQLQFTLDNPDAAKTAARVEAFTKAKAKAQDIASEGGFDVGRLISVQVNDSTNQPIYYEGMMGGLGAGAPKAMPPSPAIEPGSQDVKVSVYLTYEIE